LNQKGSIMRAMMGGLMFIIGIMILTVLWGPLYNMLLPFIGNADNMTGGGEGGVIQSIVLLIPMIVTFTGAALIIYEAFERGPQY